MIGQYSMLTDEMKGQFKIHFPKNTYGRLLEVGTGFGHSAHFFAQLRPQWEIITVDGFGLYGDGRIYEKWESEKIKEINQSFKGTNIIQILGDSSTINWQLELDVLYIDGDHTYEGCRADYNNYSAHVRKGGIICFDDIPVHTPSNKVAEFVKTLDLELLYLGQAAIFRK